ncbi:hypothetical protein Vretimale_2189 [Volvox reticuliferus]|nr:hypothetical protein Vretimale_2189 [Volvox reticuliferus]
MRSSYSTCAIHTRPYPLPCWWPRPQIPVITTHRFGRVVNQLDELWLDLSRELGEKPEQLQCGMLFRGSNNSALATAITRMTGRLSSAGKGGKVQPGRWQNPGGSIDGVDTDAEADMEADTEVKAEADAEVEAGAAVEADMDATDLPYITDETDE